MHAIQHNLGRLVAMAVLGVSLLAALPSEARGDQVRRREINEALSSSRAMPGDWIASLARLEVEYLIRVTRDPDAPLIQRWRAMGLTTKHTSEATTRLWQDALAWRERSLRTQAAWSLGLSAGSESDLIKVSERLLSDSRKEMREVGAHLLLVRSSPKSLARAARVASSDVDADLRVRIRSRLDRIQN